MTPLDQRLHPEALRLVALTKRLCVESGYSRLCPEAYAIAILTHGPNSATQLVESLGGKLSELLTRCRDAWQPQSSTPIDHNKGYFAVGLDASCEVMAQAAERYRVEGTASTINAIHLLLGSLSATAALARIFEDAGMGLPVLEAAAPRGKPQEPATPMKQTTRTAQSEVKNNHVPSTTKTPLSDFCVDLTAMAAAGQLDPLIGRERESARIDVILSRRRTNNPLLVGPHGTGKSAIVEGLAQRIVRGQVPQALLNRRIYSVDLAALVAGTQYRGQFEERIKALLDVARTQPGCILFVDEVHTLLGAGGAQGTLDAGNILKPALARGGLTCIGATTESEYRKYFAKDKALDRRFQRVLVDESTPQDTIAILKGIRPLLEQHHHCTIKDETIEAVVELSGRHITDRFFPDKAIDVLDEVCARFAGNRQPIGREEAARTVADQIGAPLETVLPGETPRDQLVEEELRRLVVGQDEAIDDVTQAVRRAFSPLRDPSRPLASLVFGGCSSVGKSYVAQILSRQLYARSALIHINLAEYTERYSVSRLLGAPPGYIGHDDANQLTDPVMRHPHSVLLFDNLDKAHPEVMDVLMEIMDMGLLTDSRGNEVSFRSTFIIMTTVVGSGDSLKADLGFGAPSAGAEEDPARQRLVAACRLRFGDEFVNRIDQFIPFQPLGRAELRQVAALTLSQIQQRLAPAGITLGWDNKVLDHLAGRATNARIVRALIKNEIEPVLWTALGRSGVRAVRLELKGTRYAAV